MDSDEMFGVQDAVLVLACGVDDFSGIILTLISNRLAKSVLNRGVVAVDEMAIDELNRKGRLSWF